MNTFATSANATQCAVDDEFLEDVLDGLTRAQKSLPCKYFYDEKGSELFERICELEEYYPTRTEMSLMHAHVTDMAAAVGPDANILEFGSGAGIKTRLLLRALDNPRSYTPVDISGEILLRSAAELRIEFPGLQVHPVLADYTSPLPELAGFSDDSGGRRVVYFPGSTLGNFDRLEATAFLSRIARLTQPGGGLLIGLDLVKDSRVLERAYDDAAGVTAAFNLNLLERINRELDADFAPDKFSHCAIYNAELERIEMYLVSHARQAVVISGHRVEFDDGETIHTENSHKYTIEGFAELAAGCGLVMRRHWVDERGWFAVFWLESPDRENTDGS